MVDDFEPHLIFWIVDRTDVGQMVEGCLRRIMQIARNLRKTCGRHGDSGLGTCGIHSDCEDRIRKFRLQAVEQSLHRNR